MSNEKLDFICTSIREKLALGHSLEDAEFALRKVFDKTEVQEAVRILKESNPALAGEVVPVAVSEKLSHLGWYPGPNLKPESHWSLLINFLKNKQDPWSPEMVRSLDLASSKVMDYLSPPKAARGPIRTKGLVLGYIQSGKTANFSAVIAKAVDAGYKLIVVLSGMHNSLRLQTQMRLSQELVDPKPSACTTLTRVDELGDFDKRQAVSANRALGSADGFTLVVLKKNTHVLRNFNEWLKGATTETIQDCSTLIIDDEADQASINTAKPENDPSAINAHIRDLLKTFSVSTYLGYTATPYANVLVDGSEETDVYPSDFLVSLDKPPAYFGPEELFGSIGVNGREEKRAMPVIRTIAETEVVNFKVGEKIPSSLQNAIRTFLMCGTVRLLRGQRSSHITMLVHTSQLKSEHDGVIDWVRDFLRELEVVLRTSTILPREFAEIFEQDIRPTSDSLGTPIPRIDEKILLKELKAFASKIELVLDNSQSEERLSFDRNEPLWGIVVGGNTLSRGLTIEGLTVSYFTRSGKQYDSLLQMGRWFGYRKGFVDLTRIFVTNEMRRNFYYLAAVEQEIRDEIASLAANNEKPIDVALRIRQLPYLKVTAPGKMRNARKASMSLSGTKVQFRTLATKDLSRISANEQAVGRLFQRIRTSDKVKAEPSAFEDLGGSDLYRRVPAETVLQFLNEFKFEAENLRFDPTLGMRYISDLNKFGELNDWSVALMSSKSGTSWKPEFSNRELFLIERSTVPSTYDRTDGKQILASLTPPGNELIDLGDILKPEKKSLSEYELVLKTQGLTDTKIRHRFRPAERGLVLVYPLSTQAKASRENELECDICPLFGVTIVFPVTGNDRGFQNYVENLTI